MTDPRLLALISRFFGVELSDGTPLPLADDPGGLIASGVTDDIPWAVLRAPIWGTANGYVYVGPEHPLLDDGERAADDYLDVPGGWSYRHVDGWMGFDTAHGGDVWPGMPDAMKSLATIYGLRTRYWDDDKVEAATRRLAAQVATCNRLGLWEHDDD